MVFRLSIGLPCHLRLQRLQFKTGVVNAPENLRYFLVLSQTLNNLLKCCDGRHFDIRSRHFDIRTRHFEFNVLQFHNRTETIGSQLTTDCCTALLQIWYHFRVPDAVLTEFHPCFKQELHCLNSFTSEAQIVYFRVLGSTSVIPHSVWGIVSHSPQKIKNEKGERIISNWQL